MSMSDDPAGFRRGQPNDRRSPQNTTFSDDRRFGAGSDAPRDDQREAPRDAQRDAPREFQRDTSRTHRFSTYQGGADAIGRNTVRAPSSYAGYTTRPERVEPRLDPRSAEPRQERYSPAQESYPQAYGGDASRGEPRRGQTQRPGSTQRPESTQRPGWEQQRESAAPASYPAYPGPGAGQTQRYVPQPQPSQQQYYPQAPQTYSPSRDMGGQRDARFDARQEPAAPQGATSRYTDTQSGYAQSGDAYDSNAYYQQAPADYQATAYQPQPYDRTQGQDRFAPPQQTSEAQSSRESYFTQEPEDHDDHGLMGGGPSAEAVSQRFAPQTSAYAGEEPELDPRAGNYPIARTTQDDDLDADFFGDEEDFDVDEDEAKPGGRRKIVAAVLASAILVSGGGFYYFKHRNGGSGDSGPPTFAMDNKPIKDAPANPGGKKFPNGSKYIYDRLGGEGGQEASVQQASATGGGGSIDERIDRALQQAKKPGEGGAQSGPIGEAPRPVSTFRVYPDGRTEEPKTAAMDAGGAGGESDAGGRPAAVSRAAPDMTSNAAPAPEEPDAAAQAQAAQAAARGKPARGAAKVQQIATVDSTPTPAPAAPIVAAASGGYYAQVGARNDQNQALAALAEVQSKYGAVLGSYPSVIHKADLGAKGVWYRVRVGPIEDKDTANGLCEKLKGAGQKACMVVKE